MSLEKSCESAENCFHLAVEYCGEQSTLQGNKTPPLVTCLRCQNTFVLTKEYQKTDRYCGLNEVYIKRLYKGKEDAV